jgi:hypothetical protein
MTQYERPDADTDIGDWLNSEDDTEGLFDFVNELDDDTYIYVEEYGSGSNITFRLSDVDTPDSGTRTVTVRADDNGDGQGNINITVALLEGGSSIATASFSGIADSPTNYSFNITSSISDYSNLSILITAQDMQGMGTTAHIYNIFFAVPDAAAAEAANHSAFLLFLD